jgi:hypothetical protein
MFRVKRFKPGGLPLHVLSMAVQTWKFAASYFAYYFTKSGNGSAYWKPISMQLPLLCWLLDERHSFTDLD